MHQCSRFLRAHNITTFVSVWCCHMMNDTHARLLAHASDLLFFLPVVSCSFMFKVGGAGPILQNGVTGHRMWVYVQHAELSLAAVRCGPQRGGSRHAVINSATGSDSSCGLCSANQTKLVGPAQSLVLWQQQKKAGAWVTCGPRAPWQQHDEAEFGVHQGAFHQPGSPVADAGRHREQLRHALGLPPLRFAALAEAEPALLAYEPHTLELTLDALEFALHTTRRGIIAVAEARPSVLLRPQEPVAVLTALSALLQRSVADTAFLLAPYPQLLALEPEELRSRVYEIATTLRWSTADATASAAAAAAGPSLLPLLAMPHERITEGLKDMAAALDADEALAAALITQRPVLLQMSCTVLRSRLFILAEAAGADCAGLLCSLVPQQVVGLAGLLLLSPARLQEQLLGLEAVLGHRLPRPAAVGLLLRLGGPNTLAGAQVNAVALEAICLGVQRWVDELASAGEADLAVLLAAAPQALAQARYLSRTPGGPTSSLLSAVMTPPAEFKARHGAAYAAWLAGKA